MHYSTPHAPLKNQINTMKLMMQILNRVMFFAVIVMYTSCIGQVKTRLPNGKGTESVTAVAGQPKLVKTQGSKKEDNVCCGLQDKAGNLWFGTTGEGVYHYDGKSFIQYTVKDGLSSNGVYSILEDRAGNIWLGTVDGICRYDGKNISPVSIPFSIRPVVENNYYSSQSTPNTVWSMLQDKSGKIWFGTGDGVYCYNGFGFNRFLNNDGVINEKKLHLKLIDCMVEDKRGNIWFASGCPPGEEGVCRYDGRYITSSKPNGDGWVRYIREDKNGNLWFGGRGHGNFIYDGGKFTNFTDKVGIGNPMLVDKSGNIWFGGEEKQSTVESDGGIWCYDGNAFKNFGTKDGMSKYFVWSMLEDAKGNIWIGTRNTGLYKYDGKTFSSFSE
jgi:ligand-binding sensor domain-containing protein